MGSAFRMTYCETCGMQLPEGNHYCPNCGTITDTSPAAQRAHLEQCPPKGTRYAPIGSWAFFGSLLLMGLPVAGLIITIVWACGGAAQVNRIHLARAMLLLYAFALVLAIAASVFFASFPYYFMDIVTTF